MAQAVKELWPEVKLAIGPAIEDGFYYDFDTSTVLSAGKKEAFTDDDLARIEKKMAEIISKNKPFIREELDKKSALDLFKKLDESYKVELINALPEGTISIYKTGENFLDLCRGPHVKSTGEIKAFKLLSVTGAYWHGIETNPMLQRIYGTCFESKKELDEHLNNLEEAKLRDHRKLGPALELFDIYHEEAGAGLVFYHPKGGLLRTIIEDYEKKEHLKRGYQIVITPHIMQAGLWKRSGHYDYYKDNMYIFKIDEQEYVLKPMNCPGHILIYKSKTRSYKDLPIRYFELGTVYRHEKTGVLHGLLRVRGFTQDDAHIFCLPEQLEDEIKAIIDFVFDTMKVFGFNTVDIELSTRPEKSIGSDDDWQKATQALENALREKGLKYQINAGDGAFYGPKIDIKIKDALKRSWQCATIQCDFALPKRFNLSYVDKEGKERQPIMLHRVLLGSLERFVGALVENYNGDLPLWLAPVQVLVIPINPVKDRTPKVSDGCPVRSEASKRDSRLRQPVSNGVKDSVLDYAKKIEQALKLEDIRVEIDSRNETLDKKVRNAQMSKIPYCLVVGEREEQSGAVAVRKKGKGDLGAIPIAEFIDKVKEEIKQKGV